MYTYQRVDDIPTRVNAASELFDQYLQTLRQYYSPGARINNSPSFRLKRSLISLATFGYGNRFVEPDETAQRTFESFQDVLRTVLPPDLKFKEIRIKLPDVILHCETGDFSLDAASGGIAALIDLAWQVHMKSLATDQFVVIIDEPENHLHPRLQRTILPGFATAFKKAQFIIATHNPFIVTSMRDASVVVLDFIDKRVHSKDMAIDRSDRARLTISKLKLNRSDLLFQRHEVLQAVVNILDLISACQGNAALREALREELSDKLNADAEYASCAQCFVESEEPRRG